MHKKASGLSLKLIKLLLPVGDEGDKVFFGDCFGEEKALHKGNLHMDSQLFLLFGFDTSAGDGEATP